MPPDSSVLIQVNPAGFTGARIFEYCRAHPRGRASLSRRTEPRRRAGERSSPDPGDSRAELVINEARDCSTADLYILSKLYDTVLTGPLDRSALYGVLAEVEALGLDLVEVRQLR